MNPTPPTIDAPDRNNPPTPEALVPRQAVSVEQIDREAAAALFDLISEFRPVSGAAQHMLDGKGDASPFVQAFARHRISHAPAAKGAEREFPDWKLVPVEPTQDMCDNATAVLIDDGRGRHTALNWSEAAAVYRTMLTAAPSSPSPAALGGDGVLREAVGAIMGRCEALEDEASDGLATVTANSRAETHEAGFWRGQKSTAKSIRNHLHDLTRTAPKAPAAPIRDPVDGIREAYDAGFDAGIKGVYDSDRGASK